MYFPDFDSLDSLLLLTQKTSLDERISTLKFLQENSMYLIHSFSELRTAISSCQTAAISPQEHVLLRTQAIVTTTTLLILFDPAIVVLPPTPSEASENAFPHYIHPLDPKEDGTGSAAQRWAAISQWTRLLFEVAFPASPYPGLNTPAPGWSARPESIEERRLRSTVSHLFLPPTYPACAFQAATSLLELETSFPGLLVPALLAIARGSAVVDITLVGPFALLTAATAAHAFMMVCREGTPGQAICSFSHCRYPLQLGLWGKFGIRVSQAAHS